MSQTRDNIRKKRLNLLKRKIIGIFRMILKLALMIVIVFGLYRMFLVGASVYGEYRAMYDEFRLRRDAGRTPLDAKFDGYLNALVLGVDGGESGSVHADTVILMSMNGQTGAVSVISMPRGTWVTDSDGKGAKIGDVFAKDGAAATMTSVKSLLGVSVHYYAVIDTRAIASLIDAIGGLDVYVETRMDYEDPDAGLAIHIPQGFRHMDGDTAQKYLRYRSGELGDIGRVHRQHRFMKSLYNRMLQIDTLAKIPNIAKILQEQVDTNIEVWDTARIADVLKNMSKEPPETLMLPGETWQQDESVWLPDEGKINEKIKLLFPEEDDKKETP